jgi:ATP-dependent RNA helicase RhlE
MSQENSQKDLEIPSIPETDLQADGVVPAPPTDESTTAVAAAADESAPDAPAAKPADGTDAADAPVPDAWDQLGLSEDVLAVVKSQGYEKATPVQARSIPLALDGRDLIASAQTGTGKTASFVLPMVERFKGREGTYGLVLAPTREIAQQIEETIRTFGGPMGVRSAVLIGGVDMRLDTQALATYPQIIVATPGRLCDHLERGNIWLEFIEVVVLDEADRMLDMGFSTQINRVFDDLPQNRQTMLFSATFPPPVEKLARKILHEPERIMVGRTNASATTIEQRLVQVREDGKSSALRKLLSEVQGSTIIFTRSKDLAKKVFLNVHRMGFHEVTYISSDRAQNQREEALSDFKKGVHRILVATDVAARGLHIEGVAHVINYDLPMVAEDYVHRIGRTGRAGASGLATSLVTSHRKDRETLKEIERLIKRAIPVIQVGSSRSDEQGSEAVSAESNVDLAPSAPEAVKDAAPKVKVLPKPLARVAAIEAPVVRESKPVVNDLERKVAAELASLGPRRSLRSTVFPVD